jgi:wyosine [tRNA(Phe)-imidazoG37] synthetase (radical SAM superfamily)
MTPGVTSVDSENAEVALSSTEFGSRPDRAPDAMDGGSVRGQVAVCELPIVFGPVKSRRLGWSLGINNVAPKTCSYSCVYCQVGATTCARVRREVSYAPSAIAAAVKERLEQCRQASQPIDYATFVPDGEPTLDAALGESIQAIQALGLRVAVITNGSLLWREDVRADLEGADWVSLKIDTVDEMTWRRLNRPVARLDLGVVLEGMRRFAAEFHGHLATETMLVEGVNDGIESVERVARFVRSLGPGHAYVTVPTRPGTEPWVHGPSGDVALRAAELVAASGISTTLLRADESQSGIATSPDAVKGLVGILAVHPMTEDAARDYAQRSDVDWSVIQRSIDAGRIVHARQDGVEFLRLASPRRKGEPGGAASTSEMHQEVGVS